MNRLILMTKSNETLKTKHSFVLRVFFILSSLLDDLIYDMIFVIGMIEGLYERYGFIALFLTHFGFHSTKRR